MVQTFLECVGVLFEHADRQLPVVYEDANETYIKDRDLAMRMLEKNPNALKDMVQTFLETDAKGYWEATEEDKERLIELYQMCEEKIEGVDFVESSFTASKALFTDE